MSQPLPPVKPTEKLPVTYHLTLVREKANAPERTIVATKMQGNEVKKRVVVGSMRLQEALDEMNRIALRIFYFDAPEEVFGTEG